MKKTLFIIALVVFVLGLAFGIYYFLFANKEAEIVVDEARFGLSGDEAANEIETGPEGETVLEAGEVFEERLIRITEQPTSLGAVAIARKPQDGGQTGGDIEVRYIDRASGNIYAFLRHERTLTRINNRTLPGVQKATWLSDGSHAFVTYLTGPTVNETETFYLPAEGDGGYVLERGLSQVLVSGTSTLITLLPGPSGSVATIAKTDGTSPKTLFTTPLTNIRLYASNGPFVLATKASVSLDGYAFQVSSGGELTRVIGPHRGLTVLPSPSGKLILYSYLSQGILRMSVYDVSSGSSRQLPVATLTDKCVWADDSIHLYCSVPTNIPSGVPDSWYQGTAQFSDRLWDIDMSDGFATLLVDPSQTADAAIDGTGLAVDSRQDALVFRNKTDGSLWLYDL